jgi:hypothetical protein
MPAQEEKKAETGRLYKGILYRDQKGIRFRHRMHQAKKQGIADRPVANQVVVSRGLDISIGIVEEVGKRITAFKEGPGERHCGKKNTPISGRRYHGSDPMKIAI